MRLFGYYAIHSFINQLRKLMKTWVFIFIVVCFLIGGLIGFMAVQFEESVEEVSSVESFINDSVGEDAVIAVNEGGDDAVEIEETSGTDAMSGEAGESAAGESAGEVVPETGIRAILVQLGFDLQSNDFLELMAGLIILIIIIFSIFNAEKNASRIFQPADVYMLFSAPIKPQTILMFRVVMQMAIALLLTVYFFMEIPLLSDMFSLSPRDAMFLIISWGLSFLFAKLIQVLLYLIYADHPKYQKYISYGIYAVLAAAACGFLVFHVTSGLRPGESAMRFFCSDISRYVPIWGQLKALAVYSATDNMTAIIVSLAVLAVFAVLLLFAISKTRGDYYEDAMYKSEELAERLKKMRESKGLVASTRKKDYDEKLMRNEFNSGSGANVFFYKTMYNRRRFAKFGVFTKTLITYLVISVLISLAAIFMFKTTEFAVTAAALGVAVFYRTLGNPLDQDTSMDYFRMIPESAASKLFYSLMGGTVSCMIDLVPAFIVGALIMKADPVMAVLMFVLIVTIDFYATTVSTFINLSVPVQAGKMLKQIVQVMFVYFGLIPDIAFFVVGIMTGMLPVFLVVCCIANVVIGFMFFALASVFTS